MTRPIQKVDMRKEAFVGRLLGAAARGVGEVGGRGLGFVRDTFTNNPVGALMSVGMGVPVLATIQNPLKDPETLARGYSSQRLIAQQNPGLAMKLSSSVLSQSDFDAARKIYGQLEKSASYADLAKDLSKAVRMHGITGHLSREVIETMDQARAAGRAAREADKFPFELNKLKQELKHNAARANREVEQLDLAKKKFPFELDKLKQDLKLNAERANREADQLSIARKKLKLEEEAFDRAGEKFPEEMKKLKQELELNAERAKREADQLEFARRKIALDEQKLTQERGFKEQEMGFKTRQEQREKERHEKEMKRWGFGQVLGAGLGLGAAATLVGAGSSAMGHLAGRAQEELRGMGSDKRYKEMLRVEPSLKDEPRAKAYFKILDRASPYMAGEPYLAAATVQQMVSTPSLSGDRGVPSVRPEMLSQILKAEQARQETRFPFLNKRDNSLRDVASLGG